MPPSGLPNGEKNLMKVSWTWAKSNGRCDKCDHIAKTETNFYYHRKICYDNMSNHTKCRGYKLFDDMMRSKSIELVKSLWLARKPEQKDLLECFDVLAEEVKRGTLGSPLPPPNYHKPWV